MGRGGAQAASPSSSPVPVLRALRGPGGGFNHKQLNATTSGAYKPAERSISPIKDIGARNRRGRANVGVSNRISELSACLLARRCRASAAVLPLPRLRQRRS